MRIIREADGGLYTHKKKFLSSIQAINEVGNHGYACDLGCGETYYAYDFFDDLCENNTISVAAFMAGARAANCLSEEDIRAMASDMRAEGLH